MSRTIHADTIAGLSADQCILAHIVKIDFSTPVYITDHSHDVTYDSQVYDAGGHLLGISQISESAEMRVGSFSITLSGVEQTYIATLLGNNVINISVEVGLVVLNTDGTIKGEPIYSSGFIDGYSITDQADTSTINLSVSSHWADFEKKAGRRTNTASQQMLFPGDKFFEHAPHNINDIRWGRA